MSLSKFSISVVDGRFNFFDNMVYVKEIRVFWRGSSPRSPEIRGDLRSRLSKRKETIKIRKEKENTEENQQAAVDKSLTGSRRAALSFIP